jgi:hypothetical protein
MEVQKNSAGRKRVLRRRGFSNSSPGLESNDYVLNYSLNDGEWLADRQRVAKTPTHKERIMILRIFTVFHVIISLLGILSGFVVIYGMHTANPLNNWTAFFLVTTVATSVTGFFFPVKRLMPSHIVGIISLVVLALAIYARYHGNLAGSWRWIYVVSAVLAQYLNFFVLIVQSFQKIPALKAIAPTQTEPPFKLAQLFFLILFVAMGVVAVLKFHV